MPEGELVVFSAHGVAPSVHENAAARSLRTIDATCPLVTKVHVEARKFAEQGYTIVLIGHEGHEEVEGTTGEAPDSIVLVQTAEDVDALEVARPRPGRLHHPDHALGRRDRRDHRPPAREVPRRSSAPKSDDICYATTNRQIAVKQLARECDLVLVIGSTNSSNSNRLVEVAREHGAASHLIDNHAQVDEEWLEGVETVGITSGASAPEELVEQLVELLPRARRRRRLRAADRRRGRPLHAPEGDPRPSWLLGADRRSRPREVLGGAGEGQGALVGR